MIGFVVKCNGCGRDDINIVYYVGKVTTHCAECYLEIFNSIVHAEPKFNIDAVKMDIDARFEKPATETNRIRPFTKVQPINSIETEAR
jgi:hypothetical protein